MLDAIRTFFARNDPAPAAAEGDAESRRLQLAASALLLEIAHADNAFSDDGLQGIKVQGPREGDATDLPTTRIVVCRNHLFDHDLNPSGSPYNNANGLTVANGARNVTVEDNDIEGNDVGIHVTQETTGRAAMDGVVLRRNRIHDNRRFGIFFYDGANGATAGKGAIRSEYDLVWGNGVGVQVGRASTNKTIKHLTADDNVSDGVRIGEGGHPAAGASVIDSLLSHNGGYGFQVASGSTAKVSYTGTPANTKGSSLGSATKTALNTQPAGYLSTTPGSTDFLRIGPSSYQQHAGSDGGPVGARS